VRPFIKNLDVIFQAKVDAANRPMRLKVMQLKDDVAQIQNRLQVRYCSRLSFSSCYSDDTDIQDKTREIAAARDTVSAFWRDEESSGDRDNAHREQHAVLLQQLQKVYQQCSSLHDVLESLAQSQMMEFPVAAATPLPFPYSPPNAFDQVVIGR
jgi:hypothetical protein